MTGMSASAVPLKCINLARPTLRFGGGVLLLAAVRSAAIGRRAE